MKRLLIFFITGLLLIAAVGIAGCVDTPQTEPQPTTTDPTERELEISKTYHEALWADPDVPESEVQSAVANQYGITPEELSEIYGRVIDYNLKKYGSVTGNW